MNYSHVGRKTDLWMDFNTEQIPRSNYPRESTAQRRFMILIYPSVPGDSEMLARVARRNQRSPSCIGMPLVKGLIHWGFVLDNKEKDLRTAYGFCPFLHLLTWSYFVPLDDKPDTIWLMGYPWIPCGWPFKIPSHELFSRFPSAQAMPGPLHILREDSLCHPRHVELWKMWLQRTCNCATGGGWGQVPGGKRTWLSHWPSGKLPSPFFMAKSPINGNFQ